jgi:hypothetical protein
MCDVIRLSKSGEPITALNIVKPPPAVQKP